MSALRRALKAVSAALQLGQAAHFAFSSVSASSAYRSGKRGCRRYRSAAQGRVHVPLYRTGVYEGARPRPALLEIRIGPLCIYPRGAERLSQCRTAMAREVPLLKRKLALPGEQPGDVGPTSSICCARVAHLARAWRPRWCSAMRQRSFSMEKRVG